MGRSAASIQTQAKIAVCAGIESPRGLAWTADRRYLIVSGKDEIVVLEPALLSLVRHMTKLGVGQIFYTTATPDGHRFLAPAVLDGVVLVVDPCPVLSRVASKPVARLCLRSNLAENTPGSQMSVFPQVSPAQTQKVAMAGSFYSISIHSPTTTIPGIPDTNGLAITTH